MRATTVANIEGLAATALVVAVVALCVTRVVAPDTCRRLAEMLRTVALPAAAAIAVVATAGSLWFSEVADFPPCKLCWLQRCAMYPLAVILLVAAIRRDLRIRPYALAVLVPGLAVSVWHNVVETSASSGFGGCDPLNPCTIRWVEGLGFWTIPRMAAAAFVGILVCLSLIPTSKDVTQ